MRGLGVAQRSKAGSVASLQVCLFLQAKGNLKCNCTALYCNADSRRAQKGGIRLVARRHIMVGRPARHAVMVPKSARPFFSGFWHPWLQLPCQPWSPLRILGLRLFNLP